MLLLKIFGENLRQSAVRPPLPDCGVGVDAAAVDADDAATVVVVVIVAVDILVVWWERERV